MKELFGIPMSSIASVLLVLLIICLVTVLYIFLRKPIVFKMGIRNIPRRPAQTILIIIGLMLSTLIVTSALGVGDTLDTSVRDTAYSQLGQIDEQIIGSLTGESSAIVPTSFFPESTFADVQTRIASVEEIDGLLPGIFSQASVISADGQRANSQIVLTGLDPQYLEPFGGFTDLGSGDKVDFGALPDGSGVVSKALAEDLRLSVGDTFTLFVNGQPTTITVAGIVKNTSLVGTASDFTTGETNESSLALKLSNVQTLLNLPGQINQIFVSQIGPVEKSRDEIDDVTDKVAPLLEGSGVGINPAKSDFLAAAEGISSGFTGIFIVLGLFSIAAGILLIVLIFTMLAAERRSEMGMARAVGQRRLQLIQQFISEGAGYALLSGVVGVILGIGATFIMARVLNSLIGESFPIKANVSPTSLIASYSLGVFITFATVVAASWRVSRLNIVAAVRDIPDETKGKRRKRTLVWGTLLSLAGLGLLMTGVSSGSAFPFYAGISLLPFGIAILLVWFGVSGRVAFSAVGLWLLVVWLLPDNIFEAIFGEYDGDIEMFFLSGIFLVIGSTILIVQNTTTLLALVTSLGGLFKSKLAAVKLAVAYPGQARGRTGMAIAMFSLIIFSLVMIATITQNLTAAFLDDEALAGWNITARGNPGQPVPDFAQRVQSADIDQADVEAIGKLQQPTAGSALISQTGPVAGPRGTYPVYAADTTYLETTEWKFEARATGYDNDEAIAEALLTQPNVVVVDYVAAYGDPFGPGSPFEMEGVKAGENEFAPITLDIQNADGSGTTTVTVIGVISQDLAFFYQTMIGNVASLAPVVGQTTTDMYYVKTRDGADSTAITRAIEATVIEQGVKVTSIQDVLEDQQKVTGGFLYLIQGFMGLGLVVGLAAIGVISFRSVVERRQQIGMIRALGFQKNMVSSVFLIETAYIVILGVIAGTATGLALARNLLTSDSEDLQVSFEPPYLLIAVILIGTVVIALLTAWIPSRQASNVAPADALRYE